MCLSRQIKRHHRFENQPHVMIDRQPAHKYLALADLHPADHLADVRQQVRMCEYHAFWVTRAPRSILKEGDIIWLDRWKIGLSCFPITILDGNHVQPSTYACFFDLTHFIRWN